jgi:hypothetical protein
LEYVPEFALAVLMIFSGWKMLAGLFHVAAEGQYAFILSTFCAIFVWRLGIFEGLLISLGVHGLVSYVVYRHHDTPTLQIIRNLLQKLTDEVVKLHQPNMIVETDTVTGGRRYRSIRKHPSDRKNLMRFIADWGQALNSHNVLSVLNHYDYDALLWGTFASHLGSGHLPIKKYFEHLMELKNLSVTFHDDLEVRQYNDIFVQSGSYTFRYQKRAEWIDVPARYSFVCKKDRNSWYILEHHSSQLPD